MARIATTDVILYQKTQTGVNSFNEPIFSEQAVKVSGVLIAPTTSNDVVDENSLTGRKEVYTIALPKDDTHDWINAIVEWNGKRYKQFGEPLGGIKENIPLDWNVKVTVERYE